MDSSVLVAPPAWRAIDFISDLHLQASDPLTFSAWQAYMATTSADAVFILGDLFEVWVGDEPACEIAVDERAVGERAFGRGDGADSDADADADADAEAAFARRCATVLRQTALRVPVFFMHGNRDFLVGPALMAHCGCTLLDDPTVLIFGTQRWLLSHGDALCLADTEYLKSRAILRSEEWQQPFLALPLAQRRASARDIRNRSEAHQQSLKSWADVDTDAAIAALRNAGARTMIHGHTHRPADHWLAPGLQRMVLSDWDMAARPPRAQVLRLSLDGAATDETQRRQVSASRIAPASA